MAVAKKALLIEYELDFLDKQLAELKEGKRKSIPAFFSDESAHQKTRLIGEVVLT